MLNLLGLLRVERALFFFFSSLKSGIKKEVTLDRGKLSFRLFKQRSRVTSPYSYYLTSLVNLSFCGFNAGLCSFEIHSSARLFHYILTSEICLMWEHFHRADPRVLRLLICFEPVGFTCTSVSPFLAIIYHE